MPCSRIRPRCLRSTSCSRRPPRCRKTWPGKPNRRFGAPLHEIYGCTETGQLASRRTATGIEWQTLADVRLRREGQTLWAEGGHIDSPTCLADVIELTGDGPVSTTFLLHGRHADLVNIAGKRTSLAYLNHQLNAIPGVQDGVFLLPGRTDRTASAASPPWWSPPASPRQP